jgi:hypothetical protein
MGGRVKRKWAAQRVLGVFVVCVTVAVFGSARSFDWPLNAPIPATTTNPAKAAMPIPNATNESLLQCANCFRASRTLFRPGSSAQCKAERQHLLLEPDREIQRRFMHVRHCVDVSTSIYDCRNHVFSLRS